MKIFGKKENKDKDLEGKCDYIKICPILVDEIMCYGLYNICPYFRGLEEGKKYDKGKRIN